MSMNHDRSAALDQALRQFWLKGYAATSLKDLEKATGMHPGSIYAAFGSKAGLFTMSMDRYSEWLDKGRQNAAARAGSWLDGLADFIETEHPLSNEQAPVRTCFMVKTALELGAEDSAIRSHMLDLLKANDRTFEHSFQQAANNGEIPRNSDAGKLARQLSAALGGICFYAMRAENSDHVAELVSDLTSRLRNGTF